MSGAPPGVKVTTMCIGLPGKAAAGWACAAGADQDKGSRRRRAKRTVGRSFSSWRYSAGKQDAGTIHYSVVRAAAAAGFPRRRGTGRRAGIIAAARETDLEIRLRPSPLARRRLALACGLLSGCEIFKKNEETATDRRQPRARHAGRRVLRPLWPPAAARRAPATARSSSSGSRRSRRRRARPMSTTRSAACA